MSRTALWEAFRQGMLELGYVDGRASNTAAQAARQATAATISIVIGWGSG